MIIIYKNKIIVFIKLFGYYFVHSMNYLNFEFIYYKYIINFIYD